MSVATTAAQVGTEFADQQFADGCTNLVDVERAMGATSEIPDGDYCWMRDNGIEPNACEYWRGYNDRMSELIA